MNALSKRERQMIRVALRHFSVTRKQQAMWCGSRQAADLKKQSVKYRALLAKFREAKNA